MNKQEIRIIVAGGRKYNNYSTVKFALDEKIIRLRETYPECSITIISGCAFGVDRLGERYAKECGYRLQRFPADWKHVGKSAGIIRNIRMADYATEDGCVAVLVAVWNGTSRGTEHMISVAKGRDMDVHVIRVDY